MFSLSERVVLSTTETEDAISEDYGFADSVEELRLNSFGFGRRKRESLLCPSLRSYTAIHLVEKGCGEVICANKAYAVHEGQFFVLHAGQIVSVIPDEAQSMMESYICFEGRETPWVLEQMGLERGRVVWEAPQTLQTAFHALVQELCASLKLKEKLFFQQACLYRMIHLFAEECLSHTSLPLLSVNASRGKATAEEYVRETCRMIERDYAGIITAELVARQLSLSVGYLNRVMRRQTGKTVHEYLMNYRYLRARQLLKKTDKPIKEICMETGFSDQLYFSRFFRKCCGLSPLAYRKAEKEKEKQQTADSAKAEGNK